MTKLRKLAGWLPAVGAMIFNSCVIGWLHCTKPQLLGSSVPGNVVAVGYTILFLLWWGLAPAAAACLFDRNRDRIVCIYEGEPDAAALARAMRRLVPKYMLPNIYEKLDALPMNANGKIDRVKLKEQFIHAED